MKGRTILYTGAAGGLGLDTSLLLMRRGATVVAIDNDPAKVAKLRDAAAAIDTGQLIVSTADLSDLAGFRAELDRLIAELRQLLQIAARTPDHGKLAPWRFVIVGADQRDRRAGGQ